MINILLIKNLQRVQMKLVERKENYKTFSVPIKKEITKIE